MVVSIAKSVRISAGATRNIAVDCQDDLDVGELLSGTPTIAEQTTSDLTLSSKQVSTVELTINERTTAIGQAVQCTVSGQNAGTNYVIQVTVGTDQSQTLVFDFTLECVA